MRGIREKALEAVLPQMEELEARRRKALFRMALAGLLFVPILLVLPFGILGALIGTPILIFAATLISSAGRIFYQEARERLVRPPGRGSGPAL